MRLPLQFSRARFALGASLILWRLLLTGPDAGAQLAPADDFFHGGAQLYLTNNIAGAKEIVAQGRKLYPENEKLKKLEELLKQQNQQQQSQQNQPPQKSQDPAPPQKSDEKKDPPPKNPEDQKSPDEKKPDSSDAKKDDPKKSPDEKKADEEKKASEKPEEKNPVDQPVKPGEMSPEEAKRLLDAQKGGEQLLPLKPQDKPRKTTRPFKDW